MGSGVEGAVTAVVHWMLPKVVWSSTHRTWSVLVVARYRRPGVFQSSHTNPFRAPPVAPADHVEPVPRVIHRGHPHDVVHVVGARAVEGPGHAPAARLEGEE